MPVAHKIEFAKHPNGHDIRVRCACGLDLMTLSRKDAMNTAGAHIKTEAAKNELAGLHKTE